MNGPNPLPEREQIVADATRAFLAVLPPDLAETVRAAAIPHWFDAPLLAGLLELSEEEAGRRYATMQEMPFVQAVGDRGHALHELTRRLLLDELWAERQADFRAWSRRAAEHFGGSQETLLRSIWNWLRKQLGRPKQSTQPADDQSRIEAIYHWLVADPDRGADLVWGQGAEWYNTFRYNLVYALVQAGLEHDAGGRLAGRARGWVYYLNGLLHSFYSENREAAESLRIASEATGSDRQLEANCIQGLGDVSLAQADYPAARAAYATARPIYAAIGARLGEANCIKGLGNVSLAQADYPAARAAYETARPIYAAIGARLGEANCIYSLGDVSLQLADYAAARERYAEALPIYRAIGARLGEANCIRSLGEIASEMEEWETARRTCQEAAARYRAFGDAWSEANALDSLATSYQRQKLYEQAIEAFGEAIRIYPTEPLWYQNRAAVHLKLGNVMAAEADLITAAELQPDHPYLSLRRGDLALKQRQYAAAVEHYRAAIAAMPNLNGPHFGLGRALLCLGQEEEGLAEVRRALALTYAPREAKESIEELEELAAERPGAPGVAKALALARGWRPPSPADG